MYSNRVIYENKQFEGIDYSGKSLFNHEYVECTFIRCNFNSVNLSGNQFVDCIFHECDLSLIKLEQTGLKGCKFTSCKLLGVDFSRCNPFLFAVEFGNCLLDYTVFYKIKLKKTSFAGSSVREANFTESDLSGSCFSKCNLEKTIFNQTNLREVDFRSAYNFSIDPEHNTLKKARFSYLGLAGLLDKYDIEIE